METEIPNRLGLPPIDQVGFVVADLHGAIERYDPLFGPFTVFEMPITQAHYRGRLCDCTLEIALGHSGGIEVELISVKDGEAIHQEFLARGCEGPHHVRFPVDDLDATIAALEGAGVACVYRKDFEMMPVRFAYLECGDGAIIELIEQKWGSA